MRLLAFLRRAPLRLGLWMFLPMLAVGLAGELFEGRLAGGKAPGNPSTLHAVKWLLMTLFNPTPADDSWMPMSVALEVTRGARAHELFQVVFFERQIKFQYPPSSLLALEPFAYLDILSAKVLNGLNSVILIVNAALVGWLGFRLFRPEVAGGAPLPDRSWIALIAAGSGFLFYPLVQAHNLGQIQLWIDLFFSAACLFFVSGRGALAGVAIGLACALKPQFALFLPWALVLRRWDFAMGLAGCLLPIGVIALARYGLENHLSYVQVLSHLSRHGESFQFNQSMNGLMHRLLFNGCNVCPPFAPTPLPPFHPLVHYATLAVTLGLLALSFLPALTRKDRTPTLIDFSIATLCFTMASPVAWYHHYGVALPLFLVAYRSVLSDPDARTRRRHALVLVVSWALASNYVGVFNLLAGSALNLLQSHLFFGALLLLFVLLREARRGAPNSAWLWWSGLGEQPMLEEQLRRAGNRVEGHARTLDDVQQARFSV